MPATCVHKCKIFSSCDEHALEMEINRWIEENNEQIAVTDIRHSVHNEYEISEGMLIESNTWYTGLIHYIYFYPKKEPVTTTNFYGGDTITC